MPKASNVIGQKLMVVNVGLPSFADDMESQGVKVTRVDWKPPASGDAEMLRLLDKLGA
jgi:hypothetical protein